MRESKIEKLFTDECARHGFMVSKYPSSELGGMPDRVLIGHGEMFFVELKRPKGGKLSEQQKLRHEQIRDHGGVVHVISNVQEIHELLSKYPLNPWLEKNTGR